MEAKKDKIAERMIKLREKMGLTQEEMAQKIGIRQGQISAYESGKLVISETVYQLMAINLKLSKEWVQSGKGVMFTDPNIKFPTRVPKGTEFSHRWTHVRKNILKLNIAELAAALGKSVAVVGRYDTGAAVPPLDLISNFCSKYNVRAEWLIKGIGSIFVDEKESRGLLTNVTELALQINILQSAYRNQQDEILQLRAIIKAMQQQLNNQKHEHQVQ